MARPSSPDLPPNTPLSPFHTPPAGMAVPAPGAPHPSPTPLPPPPAMRTGPTPLSLLYALKRRWVMATCIGGLVATAVGVGIWFAMPAGQHQARSLVQIQFNGPDAINRYGDDAETFRRDQMVILKTRDLINRTLAEPAVAQLETIKSSEDPVRMLEEGIKVEIASPSTLAVTLTGDNLDDLRLILDTLVKKYIDDATAFERRDRDQKVKRYEALITRNREDLQTKEKAIQLLANATGTTGADNAESRLARMQAQLVELDRELFATNREVQESEVQVNLLREKLKNKQFTVSPVELARLVDTDPRVGPLVSRRFNREAIYQRDKDKAADPANPPPSVVNQKAELDELDKQIAEAKAIVTPELRAALEVHAEQTLLAKLADTEERLVFARARLADRQKYRDEFQSKMAAIATGTLNIDALKDELKPMRDYVQKLDGELLRLRTERDMEPRVRIREPAFSMPNQNLKQKSLLSVGGGLASFVGVLALVGLLEWRTRRVDGVDQVVTELGMRVLGTVPAFPTRASLKATDAEGHANWRFVLNESINSTRTMLLHTARHHSMQVVMVTSATQGEGKTSLASQLASSMATAGMRALLVDCDLRNPSVHKLFDLNISAGVSEVLCQEADVSDAVQPTAVPNLWIIPAGQCSHRVITALAQGHPLETLFNRLRGQFDFIIVDSCPVLPVADALLIGQHVDGVVFSIMQDISQLPKVLIASERLAQLNIPLVGAVVNGIRQGVYSYGYNYVKQLPA